MMLRLNNILEQLEKGELTLEDSIKFYEEGVMLSSKLKSTLKNAEERVTKITSQGEEEFIIDKEG